jgi:hypothetical protein
MNQNENLQEMLNSLNNTKVVQTKIDNNDVEETNTIKEEEKGKVNNSIEIGLTNFYSWYETFSVQITGISQIKTEVSSINTKDSMIFKIPKAGTDIMELVSFYKPTTRPILNLPPVYIKIFKNDTFEVLHQYNDEIFIKSYGIKTGLIVIYCANVSGKIVPYEKIKVKKNLTSVKLFNHDGISKEIENKLIENVDVESIQLLYKNAIKSASEFTTKESAINWFLKKQQEIVDINHLIKIDNVLIHVI